MGIGVFFEKLVGLDPTYPKTEPWQYGIERFNGTGWMTEKGEFDKTRHWTYTNCVTGEAFTQTSASSYHDAKEVLRATIKHRYGYSGSQGDKAWFGMEAARAAFALAHSAAVKKHGAALVWHRHVNLNSLYLSCEVIRGVDAIFHDSVEEQERVRARSRAGSAGVSLPHVDDLLTILESAPERFCTGSVIVNNLHVEALCVPLPFNNIMTPRYGFRHSSALEFTRHVDATAVIISKSGTISFVKNGLLHEVPTRLLDEEAAFVAFLCSGGEQAEQSVVDAPCEGDAAVQQYLTDVNAAKYFPTFAKEEIDADAFLLLSENKLEELGVPLGPRMKIVAKIAQLKDLAQKNS